MIWMSLISQTAKFDWRDNMLNNQCMYVYAIYMCYNDIVCWNNIIKNLQLQYIIFVYIKEKTNNIKSQLYFKNISIINE